MRGSQWRFFLASALLVMLAGCGDLSLYTALENESPGSFALSPDALNLQVGQQYSFTAEGGFVPYDYEIVAGLGAIKKNQDWVYTAPASISGDSVEVIIKAKDYLGSSDTATVTVFNPFSVTPASWSLQTSQSRSFTVSGGVPPYTVLSVDLGAADIPGIPGDRLDYTAPASGGTDAIRVSDSIGNLLVVSVTVLEAGELAVQLSAPTVEVGQTLTVTAVGGTSPFTYTATAGSMNPAGPTPGAAIFTAPMSAGTVTITVTDSTLPTPKTKDVAVLVTAEPVPPLAISPTGATAVKDTGTVNFSASGGVPPYAFAVALGKGSIDSTTGLYTAGGPGKDEVTVTDSVGTQAVATVRVTPH